MLEVEEIRERIEAIFRAAAEEHDIELLHEHLEESRQLHDESLSHIEALEAEIGRLKIPKSGYEKMAARFAESIEECATRVRALEAEKEQLESNRRTVERAGLALLYCLDEQDTGFIDWSAILTARRGLSKALAGETEGE